MWENIILVKCGGSNIYYCWYIRLGFYPVYGTISVICKNIPFGTYVCYEVIEELNICVDKCLINEIKELNRMGIKTIGCCCGHKKGSGYIQVSSNFVKDMKNLGYEQIPIEANGNGKWCFKPKTELN